MEVKNLSTLREVMDYATKYNNARYQQSKPPSRDKHFDRNKKGNFRRGHVDKDNQKQDWKRGHRPPFKKKTHIEKVICGYCKKPGHVTKDCYSLKRRQEKEGKQENDRPRQ
jgi:hypothetical protein